MAAGGAAAVRRRGRPAPARPQGPDRARRGAAVATSARRPAAGRVPHGLRCGRSLIRASRSPSARRPGAGFLVEGDRFHDGVDIATFCGDRDHGHPRRHRDRGEPAHFDRLLGWVGDLGPYFRRLDRNHLWLELPIVVVIDDGNGYRSMYVHLAQASVNVGTT